MPGAGAVHHIKSGDSAVMTATTTPVAELPTTLAEAQALILALAEERAVIDAENSRIGSEIAILAAANADLAAVNQAANAQIAELIAIVKMLERTLYGTRSERLRQAKPRLRRSPSAWRPLKPNWQRLAASRNARRGRARSSARIWNGSRSSSSLRCPPRVWTQSNQSQ
jgi:hypothetical protein